jgi:hypothetical protein
MIRMKKLDLIYKLTLACLLTMACCSSMAQNGNRVFGGNEMTNFSTINLPITAGQSWSTERTASPGYFSASMGAVYSGASNAFNVDGYVKKYGNEAFTFPVGSGTELRAVTISAPPLTTDAYAVAWIPGDPGTNPDPTGPNGGNHPTNNHILPIRSVSNAGYWDWQNGVDMGATGNGSGITVTVSIPDCSSFGNTSSLRLVGWNGSTWVDLSGAATASGNTLNSTLSGTMIAGISAIGIGSTAWTLPLQLLSFSAQPKDCAAYLTWTTAGEMNSSRFEIEQSSDAVNYNTVGAVNALNNNNGNNYSFVAIQPENLDYYRLKIIGQDGHYTYSPVKTLELNCNSLDNFIKVYPDPVRDGQVFVFFKTKLNGNADLTLFNEAGQQVMHKSLVITPGNNITALGVSSLAKGPYFIHLVPQKNPAAFKTLRILIE